MHAQDDLIALFADFAALGVRYLVVGAHAVAAHGRRHSPREVELWLDARRDNTLRACDALARFGVASELVESLRSAAPDEIIWLGEPHFGFSSSHCPPSILRKPGRAATSSNGVVSTSASWERKT